MTVPVLRPKNQLHMMGRSIDKKRCIQVVWGFVGILIVYYMTFRTSSSSSSSVPSSSSSLSKTNSFEDNNKNSFTTNNNNSQQQTIELKSGLQMPGIGYGTCCRKSAKGEAIYESTKLYLKYGGKLIDTAMAYNNHVEIGRAIHDSGIPRSDIWITSKIAPNKVKTKSQCLLAVDNILNELDTTYLDLLLIHSPKLGKEATLGLWEGLIEAKRLKKVKAIGVSNFNKGEIEDIIKAADEIPEANEIQQHPWSGKAWKDLVSWQSENGIATIAYTSLGGQRNHKDSSSSSNSSSWPKEVIQIAKKYQVTEAQVLLKWALQNNIAVIPGSGNEEHIKENLLLGKEFTLSHEDIMDIENSNAPANWFDPRRGPNKYTDEEAMGSWGG